ncbi:MAG: RagB/SusD family nutrient uptake outer membrane protein [Flavobacteriaceae bacterium CG18_big_fil_WC_8_21_14_2_50_34_36]|nr:RagB/SusD family nutrient uptake outer membrane protein [Flavobacteriia bacterium]NCT17541.1 RagB/SusD family nutrient uptake outer membrane protein [Flavobacteriia bacterium]PIQ18973.1 MAG: RagB/SusD family nutrient uptake outer membrane protein [Flavobacteriaceae bacterium CG18_big_fil_WC_8_21_14_2_50_34_36]
MKNILNKIAIFALILGSFASCDQELDQLPFDEFASENAFITAADFENGIRGVYSALTRASYYGSSDAGSMLSAPDVMSDNVILTSRGRQSKATLHNWEYLPASTMRGLYFDAYTVIFRANNLLKFAEDFEGDNKANIVAEAKALRALAHFDLVKVFGKIPTQSADANGSLGIAYMTEPDPLAEPARMTVGEVYQNIIADLTDAAAGINATNPTGRMGKDAINVLLSRVYLYNGEWQKAIDAANNVTTPIAPRNSVVGVWEDTNQAGLTFYIPNDATVLNLNIGVTWSQGGVNNLIPEYAVSFEFFNKFAADDIRKEAYTFAGQNTANALQWNAIKKLFGRPGQSNGLVDFKILRAEEALLNKAEAQYELGQTGPALITLNLLRAQRYLTPPSGETGVAIRDAIRLERRLEFAFEYQRFFDLKRWALPVQRTNDGDLADGTGSPSINQSLPAGSFKFQLPISTTTIDLNPNIVQNPGY